MFSVGSLSLHKQLRQFLDLLEAILPYNVEIHIMPSLTINSVSKLLECYNQLL